MVLFVGFLMWSTNNVRLDMMEQYGMPHQPIGMASVERFLQLQQDSVPCKVRAKRGCATHPRSIAERVRCCMTFLARSQCFGFSFEMHENYVSW